MGIVLGRFAMGCPAGMGDAQVADGGMSVERAFQFHYLAGGTHPLDAAIGVEYGNAGRVVTAVFQPAQTFEQDGGDITLSDGADDSTHGMFLVCWLQRTQFITGGPGARYCAGRCARPAKSLARRRPGWNPAGPKHELD